MRDIPVSSNLPAFIGISEEGDRVITPMLAGQNDLVKNLRALGNLWNVRVWFDQPVQIIVQRRYVWHDATPEERDSGYTRTASKAPSNIQVTDHVFRGGFFLHGDALCYKFKRTGRHGQYFPVDNVVKYEPVLTSDTCFASFEEFKKKFDPQFISDELVQKLWTEKSNQTGRRYCKNDFRSLGKQGRKTLTRFMENFKGITAGGPDAPGYTTHTKGVTWVLEAEHLSYRHPGRDIRISHTAGLDRVFYSSEYSGCGNGRYGLLVNKHEYLWLEDD